MTRVFCDICGKEITGYREHTREFSDWKFITGSNRPDACSKECEKKWLDAWNSRYDNGRLYEEYLKKRIDLASDERKRRWRAAWYREYLRNKEIVRMRKELFDAKDNDTGEAAESE